LLMHRAQTSWLLQAWRWNDSGTVERPGGQSTTSASQVWNKRPMMVATRLLRARYLWLGPGFGALGMAVLFIAKSFSLNTSYMVWSIFDVIILAVPLGALAGLPSGLLWWLTASRARGRGRVPVSALLGAAVSGLTGLTIWAIFPFGGPPVFAGTIWAIVALIVYLIAGYRGLFRASHRH
jgi:hypothetical protein